MEKLGEQDIILELDHFSAYCPGCKGQAGNQFQKEVLKRALNTKRELFLSHNVSSCLFPLSEALSLTPYPSPAQHLASSIRNVLLLSSLLANTTAIGPGAHSG